jgi:hypothetical protein
MKTILKMLGALLLLAVSAYAAFYAILITFIYAGLGGLLCLFIVLICLAAISVFSNTSK